LLFIKSKISPSANDTLARYFFNFSATISFFYLATFGYEHIIA